MDRRTFLHLSVGAAISSGAIGRMAVCGSEPGTASEVFEVSRPARAFSVIPVVGDGKWIWNKPPEGQTGYLEPRPFESTIGIELQGQGGATQIKASTPVPVPCPEQKIESEKIDTEGCDAEIRQLGPFARQLFLSSPQIAAGQTIRATVLQKLVVSKEYLGFERDRFPRKQSISAEVRKQYLGESPGIDPRATEVRQLLGKLRSEKDHPWDLAKNFADWIRENIKAFIGPFTGATTALKTLRGDCAEMSAVFVALCRAAEIPARLVWVPNHNWAEFYLIDEKKDEQWIPVHTACYFWFGWTGVHEMVIQKGDRIRVPEKPKPYRLLEDWLQWSGRKPHAQYTAEVVPLPPETGADPGPGARRKDASGEWKLIGNHALDKAMRR
jgi:Transglutaminase-like superfamily